MSSQEATGVERNTTQPGAASLSARDQAVVKLVGQFRQLTASHIGAVLFADRASQTPLDRTLKRLVERKYVARLTRLVGGNGGGSAQYAYQLGRTGWRLLERPGEYWAPRSLNLHTLAIADCFVALKRAEQADRLKVLEFTTEPDCHQSVGHVLLTPDAYIEIGARGRRMKYAYFLEVDRGTEHASTIQDKCERYWRAYQIWPHEFYPTVWFVVPNEQRAKEVHRVIRAGPEEVQALFKVCTHDELMRCVLIPTTSR